MIVASVAGNNNGWVVTFGLLTAVSVLVLMAFSAAANRHPRRPPPSTRSWRRRWKTASDGSWRRAPTRADVRDLVRDAVLLGRRR